LTKCVASSIIIFAKRIILLEVKLLKEIYLYNEGSKALHIEGFCPKANSPEYKRFHSESEAIKYAGRQIYLCRTCEQERDRIIRKMIMKKGEEKR